MFKELKKKKRFEEIIDQIKYLLLNKELKLGQKLPNELELSESMGVSRSSLREALKVLSILGIIESKSGEGTIIKQAQPENLKEIMSLVAVSGGLDTLELFEARRILEKATVSIVANRRTEAHLNQIENILKEMDKHYVDSEEEMQSNFDFLFHKSIVEASENRMLVIIIGVISDLLREQIRTTRSELATTPQILKRFQKEHWEIFNAIKNKDPNEASRLMDAHLSNAQLELDSLKNK
ncbi:FadR/GntR family transcriptional regulator [Bacillus sp. JJ1533]|uniref:FadR/GntR family transcriptional regulator n=1 Tax=Bacillus sp. JJ1533 TaxID=3122959 RepID=UPI003000A64E